MADLSVTQRICKILEKLIAGEHFSTEDLSCEFSCSKRTIQRDLKELALFLNITRNSQNLYYLQENIFDTYSLKEVQKFAKFSGIENLYPLLDKSILKEAVNCPPPHTNSLPNILIQNHNIESAQPFYDTFIFIKNAITQHLSVCFLYKNKTREVYPYCLLHNNGIWYLLATQKDILKYFTLSKISLLKSHKPKSFIPNPNIIALINKNPTFWISQQPIKAQLLIQNAIKEYLLRKEFLPKFKIIYENESCFLIECLFGYEFEILKLTKTFLPFIRIITPKILQTKIDKELQNYLTQKDNLNFEIPQEILKETLD